MRHGLRVRHHGVVVMFAVTAMLALAGCGSFGPLSGAAAKTPTPRATATPKPALDWRTVTLPTPFVVRTTGIAISPVNGNEAWFCAPATDAQGDEVWRTTDAGSTWVKASYITLAPSHAIQSCSLAADQGDANAVAVNVNWGDANAPVNAPQGTQSYYSLDGGSNWTTLPPDIWVDQVVTYGHATFAQFADTSQRSRTSLIESNVHLTAWSTVQTPGQDTPANFEFWAAPAPEQLLWASMNGGSAYTSDYASLVYAWKPVTPPTGGAGLTVTLATWRSNGWLICGYVQKVGTQNAYVNVCTHDGGATWATLPALKSTWECAHCGQGGSAGTGVNPCLASAISASGALYAVCGNDPQDSGAAPTPWTVSRMTPGASTWTKLGQTPCQQITTTSTGQAWCLTGAKGVTTVYVLDALP